MDRVDRKTRRSVTFKPWNDVLEARLQLSSTWPPYISTAELHSLLNNPPGNPAVSPNLPVLPYPTQSKLATFIDPTTRIVNGYAVIVGAPGFIGPYSTRNAHGGIIKIGSSSAILDNASIVANPTHPHTASAPQVLIGDHVLVSYGAQILGPSTVGAYGSPSRPTEIGPGAIIDEADIEQGAIVSPLARVGPGVTVPSGFMVLTGKDVTTDAEAADPAFGKVVAITSIDLSAITTILTANLSLATGYNTLFQGQSATGTDLFVPSKVSGVFLGNLTTIEGTSAEPDSPTASTPFLPAGASPKFLTPHLVLVPRALPQFTARVVGSVQFNQSAAGVKNHLGRSNSIRADMGGPIVVGSIGHTGLGVTINALSAGQMTIGQNFVAGNNATILGGISKTTMAIGNNVTIGNGSVVEGTSLGDGSTVGDGAFLLNSSFPAGTQVPAGAIYENNKLIGFVEP
jgi:carbonic anhydrase/acetyltransferase-like protein (isoleucine patch superfamily)